MARIADDAGDFDTARDHWEAVIGTGDAEYGPPAAHDLGQRLLERGDPARAQRILAAGLRLIDRGAAPYAYARLAVALGISYLDQAIGAFGAALEEDPSDPEVGPLATELLARTLPLRGRAGRGGRGVAAWPRRPGRGRAGAGAAPPRLRRRRGRRRRFRRPVVGAGRRAGRVGRDAARPHRRGVRRPGSHVRAARRPVRRRAGGAPPGETHEVLGRAVRVPSGYPWGPLLHESFAERLRLAMGTPVPNWPEG
ncbi:tetratricopeptide repeat protein [Actinomadura madurae]|uniref:tetratricopeptide repeat protein n=1 Tax=Actinomadura madurae TaxID=1993 RepID=UPI0020D24B1D|nr:tetratricopeptide repeat protein [Actinomadura madurae]MCQ0011738.1 tetratricopeptide repeat protein [Actinomadura madurae]